MKVVGEVLCTLTAVTAQVISKESARVSLSLKPLSNLIEEASGLGLAIARGRVGAHGGEVAAESRPGHGSASASPCAAPETRGVQFT